MVCSQMETTLQVRKATAEDYATVSEVMFDAVRNGPSKYTQSQRRAWVPEIRSGASWIARLDSQTIFLAELASECLGFMSLADKGYIDFAYVRPTAQGTGVFSRLYRSIESLALERGEARLWVHASLMAQPAFSAKGFRIRNLETVEISDQTLDRYEMEKQLGEAGGHE